MTSRKSMPLPHKKYDNARIFALIFFVLLVGAGAMYLFSYVFPVSSNILNYIFCTLALIALGLAIPYWVLKLGFHEAHRRNPQEKELHMRDIPKDQQQLKEDKKSE